MEDAAGASRYLRPSWSADLHPGSGGSLVDDGAGGCLVSNAQSNARYAVDGRLIWLTETTGPAYEAPIVSSGLVFRIEGSAVITRDLTNGAIVHDFSAPAASELTLAPWGELLYEEAQLDGSSVLKCRARSGKEHWSIRFPRVGTVIQHPASFGDVVLAHFDGRLRALTQNGTQRWALDHSGFHRAEDARPDLTDNELVVSPTAIDPSTLLVGLAWPTGRGLFLVNTTRKTVEPYAPDRVIQPPLVPFRHPDGGFRIAAGGRRRTIGQLEYDWPVQAFDPDGRLAWEHPLHTEIADIVAKPDGGLIVSATPTQWQWDTYHKWQDMSANTLLRALDADGRHLRTWYAPGPLTHLPIVGSTSTVYVGAKGKLWALTTI
ncbi:PQQ-binding-like beta-propeller repeat protein [Actinokineospora sp.]|uniref:outer membrane protein assembly factor BamB family protein n=1 Tax=Actinokineospora sp. TaxID=1872133 RepID=UPI003D6C44ED